jgi:DNA-binding transcriptional ArsR family regulator
MSLSDLYDALRDPLRRQIIVMLADGQELSCSMFYELASKTHLSYHLARLRTAGLTNTRVAGTSRFISLRARDLEVRFPGWLRAVIASIRAESAAASDAQPQSERRASRRPASTKMASRAPVRPSQQRRVSVARLSQGSKVRSA